MDPLTRWTMILSLTFLLSLGLHELIIKPYGNIDYYSLTKKQLEIRAWMTIPITFGGWGSMCLCMIALNNIFNIFDKNKNIGSHVVTELAHDEGYIKGGKNLS